MMKMFYLILFTSLMSCTSDSNTSPLVLHQPHSALHLENENLAYSYFNTQENTIEKRVNVPKGYKRIPTETNTYTHYLRNLTLKPHGSLVHYYNGAVKNTPNVYCGVLQFDVGNTDLQQCADAVMRIRAEYLFAQKRYNEISFKFTNGFNATYENWRLGYRIKILGNKCTWVKQATENNNYDSFRKYLDVVYSYAGSLSLSKQLKPVNTFSDIEPGDVLIRGGSPGHAETVMDVAMNAKGEKIFLLSQGYMPAQDIQLLCNTAHTDNNPWYEVNKCTENIVTPEYDFKPYHLMRF